MDVTLEDLRRYQHIKATVATLDAAIEDAYNTVSSPVPSEVIAGRSSVRPAGDPVGAAINKANRLRRQKEKLVEEMEAIEAFVDECPDLMAQSIMRMHFLLGKSWQQTAVVVYGYKYADGENCRMYIWRYFKHL